MKSASKNDTRQDAKMVKAGVGQHEAALHKGKPKTKLKLESEKKK